MYTNYSKEKKKFKNYVHIHIFYKQYTLLGAASQQAVRKKLTRKNALMKKKFGKIGKKAFRRYCCWEKIS
jgi:hypothetical protein